MSIPQVTLLLPLIASRIRNPRIWAILIVTESSSPNYARQRSYTDFDELCEDIQRWDLDLQQMESGDFSGEMLQFGTGLAHVSEALFQRCVLQQGTPPAGMRTIVVPADIDVRFQWRGHACAGNDLLIFPAGAELNAISNSDFHVYTCSFPEELLASIGESYGVGDVDSLRGEREVVRCSNRTMSVLQSLLSHLSQSYRADGFDVDNAETAHALTYELPRQLCCAIADTRGASSYGSASRRDEASKRAVRFIREWAHDGITISQVVDSSGVSQRTLEYAFVERFGLTPKSFLTAYRLCMVRSLLRDSHPQRSSVADAANRWGFWHMGQFAADYRRQFGELPSQTLRN